MCLVSYVPTETGFVFSSNRDEAPSRHATELTEEEIGGRTVYYPRDTKGGSWLFFSDRGEIICLLNGAFTIHERRAQYKMSRGLMLKESYQYENIIDFIEQFDFRGIEPFTTVILSDDYFLEYVWDGNIKHVRELDRNTDYNWSSCTLYTPDIQQERNRLFKSMLSAHSGHAADSVKEIHLNDQVIDEANAFKMKRGSLVQTISLSQIISDQKGYSYTYHDLLEGKPSLSLKYI